MIAEYLSKKKDNIISDEGGGEWWRHERQNSERIDCGFSGRCFHFALQSQ